MSGPSYKPLCQPGVTAWPPSELPAIEQELARLRGHAVLLDLVHDDSDTLTTVRVHHYRSCVVCAPMFSSEVE